ncbi:MAG: hypothetical protein ACW9W4_09995 [Candidatus Nitrosopumilus sp. bin_7KS]
MALKTKDEVVSLRFTRDHIKSIKKLAQENNISPTKAAENIITNHLDVLEKCFKRQDMIIQRGEMKKLYNRFSKKELDPWIETKYEPTVSCMQLFSPMLKFEEMTETMSRWFKQNGHHLYYDDRDGVRTITCANSDMGYNWLYVNGMIYFKMFNDAKHTTSDFKSDEESFEFKIKIPE